MLGIMASMNQTDIFALFVDPCRGAEVFPHGPDCSSDHRDSQLHVYQVIDAPVMQFARVPQVVIIPVATQRLIPMVSLTMEIPQLLLDEVVDVLLGMWCESHRCRRGEDSCAPTVAPVEKLVVGSS